jgi:heme exporter protein C
MTRLLYLIVTVTMLSAVGAVFLLAPTEKQMGDVQRIFYFHVASALTAGVAYLLVFVGSVWYLRTRDNRWDRFAGVSAELGVLFSAFVLFSGPLWARPIWGVFWRWEPRLTTMLITFAIYVAYLMVRSYGEPGERTQRFAAVVGIVAFVNVPLVHYSINMWAADQQLHPPKVELAPVMQQTKFLCYFAFACLFALLMRLRLSQEHLAARLQALLRMTAHR